MLRDRLVEVATTYGYPSTATDRARVAFDREAARRLYEAMPMSIGEALNREVWNFSSLVLAPDLTYWRFGSTNPERCPFRNPHVAWNNRTITPMPASSTLGGALHALALASSRRD
jgi:hypothetical protein